MSLKVHMMGPRSDKFPFKPQGSWFIKLDNKVHSMLQDRMIEEHISLEDALLKTVMEGAEIMMAKWREEHGAEHTNAQDS
jgi:phenylacetate-coenzyme A ligase PaaK-like adenylate-forming protein